MCTASWHVGGGRSKLWFNRDESLSRDRSLGPELRTVENRMVLTSIDPVGLGSWLAVGDSGTCVFLLNNYKAACSGNLPLGGWASRGQLPVRLARLAMPDALSSIESIDLGRYRPFFLGVMDCQRIELFVWDGREIKRIAGPIDFLTTSSYRSVEIEGYRKDRYKKIVGDCSGDDDTKRLRFHLDLSHSDLAFNPLMMRPDSETHNVTVVTLEENMAHLRFAEKVTNASFVGPWQSVQLSLR